MPVKDATSNNNSSFAMGRKEFIKTIPSIVTESTILQQKQQMNYGNSTSRDSASVIHRKKMLNIGKTINTNTSFMGHSDHNFINRTIGRVRSSGSTVPPKYGAKKI